jgi:hypothetical protein
MEKLTKQAMPSIAQVATDESDDEWHPAGLLEDLQGLDLENFAYKFARRDPDRIRRLTAEGWTLVNDLDGDSVQHKLSSVGRLDAGSKLTSAVDFRELVLMKLPQKRAAARRRYFSEKSERAMRLITHKVKEDANALGGGIETRNARVEYSNNPGKTTVIE